MKIVDGSDSMQVTLRWAELIFMGASLNFRDIRSAYCDDADAVL